MTMLNFGSLAAPQLNSFDLTLVLYFVLHNAHIYLNSGLWRSSTWTVPVVFVRARSGYATLGLYPHEMVVGVGYIHVGPYNFHESLEARFPNIVKTTVCSSRNCDITVGLNTALNYSDS